jgi:endo-1,4-beta-xylanase
MGRNIQRLGELGLEVQITELDVRYRGETTDAILQRQAADYYRVVQTCLESEYCNAVIVWGISDKFTWLRQADFAGNPTVDPLLFNEDYEPKPAYFAVADALARGAGVEPILSDEERDALLN